MTVAPSVVGLPPARFAGLSPADSYALIAGLDEPGPRRELALAWAEKLRRFIQRYRLDLDCLVSERCGDGEASALPMVELLLAAAGDRHRVLPDAAILNAALVILDLRRCQSPAFGLARQCVGEILDRLRQTLCARARKHVRAPSDAIPVMPASAVRPNEFAAWPVVVLSPNPHGLYTLLTLHLLEQLGVSVSGVVCRRLLSPQRLRFELARDGAHVFRKLWRKLVLRRDEYVPADFNAECLTSVLESSGVRKQSVYRYCRKRGIPAVAVGELNDEATRAFLRANPPRVVLFTGGGLIGPPTLALCGEGVLNCHHGILPAYKGMDVEKWPLLEGEFGEVGMTVHFMDPRVDAGPILARHHIDVTQHLTRESLLNSFAARMGHLLVATMVAYARGEVQAVPQVSTGRQYYYTHPRIAEIVPDVMKELYR